jgi:amino acid adenylation domain-containing protein/thioester reductase-like protein
MVGLSNPEPSSVDANLKNHELRLLANEMQIDRNTGQDVLPRKHFDAVEQTQLPNFPVGNHQSQVDKCFQYNFEDIEWPQDVRSDVVVRSTWAIILSWYCESSEIVFDAVTSGFNLPETISVHAVVEGDTTLNGLQMQMVGGTTDTALPAQIGLPSAHYISEDADLGLRSRSLLMVQLSYDQDTYCVDVANIDRVGNDPLNIYAINLHCEVKGSSLFLRMTFDSTLIREHVVLRAIDHFGHVLHQICHADGARTKISDLDRITTGDLRQIWTWNAKVPAEVKGCVHDLFSESVSRHPHKTAISAWDGELTYSQLERLSTQLAYHLIHNGVLPGAILPLFFEKSMWMPVTQYAVMKVGAASVAIDPSQTKERIKTIIDAVGPGLILCAPSTAFLVSSITGRDPFVVQQDTISELPEHGDHGGFETILPHVKPSDVLYVVFTSGTTGNPKGAAITHSNFTSAVKLQRDLLHFKPTARVANFCSCAFDVAWSDFIHTLAQGGCLCIPSEYERKNDFIGYMIKNRVTFVHLTPSVAAILNLDAVPTLDTVTLSGELVDFDKLPQLRDIETTIVTYGPSECTVTTAGVINNGAITKSTIGWACGSTTWIVDPDKDALTPVGLTGELLLEGPLVGEGYLNNAEKTAAAFIKNPSWLLHGGPGVQGRHGRLYRTGDLVRYNHDGELIYLGRKDNQVKIRGQRTELSDVEHYICRVLQSVPEVTDVIAEVVTPKVTQRSTLVAFLLMPRIDSEELSKKAAAVIELLESEMANEVPVHMIPGVYIPMTELPMTLTGKTDRRALREIGAELDRNALASFYGTMSAEHIEPTSEAEILLRELWASVLNLPVSDIGTQDSFLRLGGDSLAAIRLVTAIRMKEMFLTVTDIFSQPRLSEMAKLISRSEMAQEAVQRLSLLKDTINKDDVCRQAAELCSIGGSTVHHSQIEDIYPCTALQEGILAMTARSPGKYVAYRITELKRNIDIVRFQEAWQKVAERASVLRTRVVDLPNQGLVQVVLREALQWETFSSVHEYQIKRDAEKELQEVGVETAMGLGTPLSRMGFVHDERAGKRYFVWTQHHATYDGWSLPLLTRELEKAYRDDEEELSSLPLQSFVKYAINQHNEKGVAFWQRKFAGIEASQFPALPAKTYQPKADKVINYSISNMRWPTSSITPSSALRTAWATLVSWYVNSQDVTFGAVVSGRQAPVAGIEDIAGPTIATVPLRILVRGTVDELLHQVQRQAIEMIPFEQFGLQHIRQINKDAEYACDFQALLLIHPSIEESSVEDSVFEKGLGQQEADSGSENTFAMMLTCRISESRLDMQLSFDSVVVNEQTARRQLRQLEHILTVIGSVDGSIDISDIDRTSEYDLYDIWKCNAAVPDTVEECVHDVFAKRVLENPGATAVCSWDGELTYGQLDHFSTLLAGHLASSGLGIGPGALVPLYFEKSMWVPAAMIAVMKAGAASVALDPALPEHRLKSVVSQLSPKAILTSKSCAKLAAKITGAPIVEVGKGTFVQIKQLFQPIKELPIISPSSILYIVFTSGSTGTPKGVIITHSNFCSAIRHQQHQLGFESSSRVFDCVSHAFDVAWSNVLHTLTAGGCLCIPSEDERISDINGAINRLRANFIHLTPTVGRMIDPDMLRSVRKILFIGEPLKASDVARWEASGVEIYNTYGPAECTVTSTIQKVLHVNNEEQLKIQLSDPDIGKATGALAWVVQPDAPDRLAAIGTIGELWIEGPIVGAGYLSDTERTASAFIEDPKWLLHGFPGRVPGRRGRLYKTGDLVYFKPDGSLGFVGRKDTQVKINGQRLELGEVECHVRRLLPTELVSLVVAEVIIPDATLSPDLAVFLEMSDNSGGERLNKHTLPVIENLRSQLSKLLPSYMVPRAYIPLAKLPMTATGKMDRQRLRKLGKTYTPPAFLLPKMSTSNAILTNTEETLRNLWATLLNIKANIIHADHNFSEIGGDSIKIMSLAMAIRKQFGLNIGVPRLVRQRHSLRELSTLIDNLLRGQAVEEPTPIDLEREIDLLVSKVQHSRIANTSTVFLTGSTGYLGAYILRYTLTRRAFDRVVLLVRSVHGQKGLDRVIKVAKIAGWWKESFASKIEVWDGDLSAERFGLNDSQWNALCGLPSRDSTIDAIIHNGASVHWGTNYDGLKAVNVDSTVQLLEAAMASRFVKSFVYLSGGLITNCRIWAEEEASMASGYDQTKYVSERLVSAAASKCCKPGTKFSVVKPGQIIGDVYTGAANPDDFLWRVVICATQLGARPIESVTSWLSLSDVRHVTEEVLWHTVGKDQSNEHFFNIRRGIWVSSFWAAVEEQLQLPLRPVSWEEWIELARKDMVRVHELHPLWPLQHFLGAIGIEAEVSDNDRCEWEMQEVVAAVRQNVEFLRDKGFISTNGEYGKVLRRTRDHRAI